MHRFLIIFAVSSSQWRRMSFHTHYRYIHLLLYHQNVYFYTIHIRLHARFIHCNDESHRLHSISIFECEWWFATIWTTNKNGKDCRLIYICKKKILIHIHTNPYQKYFIKKEGYESLERNDAYTCIYLFTGNRFNKMLRDFYTLILNFSLFFCVSRYPKPLFIVIHSFVLPRPCHFSVLAILYIYI